MSRVYESQRSSAGSIMKLSRFLLTVVGVLLCLLLAQSIPAMTWHVDGKVSESGDSKSRRTAFKTIQEGIDIASDGDTVTVAEGTYLENIHFHGKNIILTSTDALDPSVVENTVIDGVENGSVVMFDGSEDETCTLAGFTIRNGDATAGGGVRGGTLENQTRAVIQNNVIIENCADVGGGLAWCGGVIRDNTISRNTAEYGGGLYRCYGTIERNNITGNQADYGGGLNGCNGRIRFNRISRNWANQYGGGLNYCEATIRNNVTFDNSAGAGGGGLASCDGTITSDTVSGNSAPMGGGLYSCDATICNCILWGNRAHSDAQLDPGWKLPTYSCIEDWDRGAEGNTSLCPHFVDPRAGDYHLQTWSPCIDAGDPDSDFSSEPQPNGGKINMGAYGNTPEAASASLDADADLLPDDWELHFFGDLAQSASDDPDADGAFNLDEYGAGTHPGGGAAPVFLWYVDGSVALSGNGRSWESAFKTIQEGIDASFPGDKLIVARGTYMESICFKGKHIILTSTDPLDPAVVANTIIDGSQSGSVVRFYGTEDETCVLSGFTIRNGSADEGGGITGRGTLATIRENVILANSAKWNGGGLWQCDGAIQNNVITGNTGRSGGGLHSCNGVIQNNLILANVPCGLCRCHGTILNNTISHNSSCALNDCQGIIRNCIMWGNLYEDQIYQSNRPSFSCIENWTGGGEGNIKDDPLFVDADGPDDLPQTWEDNDFRLQPESPCINTGADHWWFAWPQRDLDGNCRLVDGRVDMGCYEHGSSPDLDGDLLSDADESSLKTQPAQEDSDGDGLRDGLEVLRGSEPLTTTLPTVVHIRADMAAVQEALCLAVKGDEIVVAPGTCWGNLHFCGTDVTLRGLDRQNNRLMPSWTYYFGEATGPAVSFTGREDEGCVLEGFTLANGNSEYGGGIRGGTENRRTHATIQRNIITDNRALTSGGGLAFCDGPIRNNIIFNNSAHGYGGALYVCDGRIQNNVIQANSTGERGGGLCECHGPIQNNLIRGNKAGRSQGGGLSRCDGLIQNNTIVRNSTSYGGVGGVHYCTGLIRNCIIWGNSNTQVRESRNVMYCCIQDWTKGGEGNIAEDPQLVDPDGPDDLPYTYEDNDCRLKAESPCIDAGKNEEWMWTGFDLDGKFRIHVGIVDMGAYEYGAGPFAIAAILMQDVGKCEMTWNSRPGETYGVWSSIDLVAGRWLEEATVPSGGETTTWTDPDATLTCKFYRIGIE